jgi:hypothetical protein
MANMRSRGEGGTVDAAAPGSVLRVPPAPTRTIRIDDTTWNLAREECQRRGLDSTAEYVRQALVRTLAVDLALRLARGGIDLSDLQDFGKFAAMLAEAGERIDAEARERQDRDQT